MRIPQEKIEELRATTDIVDIISEYVTLKKKGNSYFGLCPFHAETAPSFAVNREKQIFRCFGCGESGNVFSFIMKKESVNFIESVQLLAKRKGIELVFTQEDRKKYSERENLYLVNEFAANLYQKILISDKKGKEGLKYFRDRGFTEEVIKKFRLGFAPDSWDDLLKAAKKEKIEEKLLKLAGLILERKNETGYYDRFRNRVIFPIQNEFGQVLGFGARRLNEDESTPKYINSPETPVYHKGKILYGISQSKDTIRKEDQALLVEGYTDLLSLHQNGISNVLATSGTALTPSQVNLISRYTKNTTLIFDADSAGLKAAIRGADILFTGNLNVSMINLGKGNDPDTFIKTKGKEAFVTTLNNRSSFIDFFIDVHKSAGSFSSNEKKSECVKELLGFIGKVNDRIKQDLMIKDISEKLLIEERTLKHELKKRFRTYSKRVPETSEGEKKSEIVIANPVEEEIIKNILNDIDIANIIVPELKVEDFSNFYLKKIFKKVHHLVLEGLPVNPAEIIDTLIDDDSKTLTAKMAMEGIPENKEKTFDERTAKMRELLLTLKSLRIQEKIEELKREIKVKQANGEEYNDLMKKYNDLILQQIEIKKGGFLWRSLPGNI